jgi:ligand-binding sensor domain-containing protein
MSVLATAPLQADYPPWLNCDDQVSALAVTGVSVWAGGRYGLLQIDAITNARRFFPYDSTGVPQTLFADRSGNLWALSDHSPTGQWPGATASVFDTASGHWSVFSPSLFDWPQYADQAVILGGLCIMQDSQDAIWVGTTAGAARYAGGVWEAFDTQHGVAHTTLDSDSGIPHGYTTSLVQDADGAIWFAAEKGISRYDGAEWSLVWPVDTAVVDSTVWGLAVDNSGTIWGSVHSYSILRYTGASWEWLKIPEPQFRLGSRDISFLLADNAGNIWAGGDDAALMKYDGSAWTRYGTSALGPVFSGYACLTCIMKDRDGAIWLGTASGLARYEAGSWTTFTYANCGIPLNDVTSLAQDSLGNIWAGRSWGLTKYDGAGCTEYSSSHLTAANSVLPSDTITCIAQLGAESFWIGTPRGLVYLDGNTSSVFTAANSALAADAIADIFVDDAQAVWIATMGGGVAHYAAGSWNVYDESATGTAIDAALSILKDSEGTLLVGTAGEGLAAYDGAEWRTYTTVSSELPGDSVRDLALDHSGTVWAATNGGIAAFAHADPAWSVFTAAGPATMCSRFSWTTREPSGRERIAALRAMRARPGPRM